MNMRTILGGLALAVVCSGGPLGGSIVSPNTLQANARLLPNPTCPTCLRGGPLAALDYPPVDAIGRTATIVAQTSQPLGRTDNHPWGPRIQPDPTCGSRCGIV